MRQAGKQNGPLIRLSAFRIALIYAAIGGSWILLSDRALSTLVGDPALLTRLQTYKGWFYVLVTAGLLHWLIRRYIAEHRQADLALQESEKRFRAIFEQAAVGVAQIETATGRFVRVNRKYCEITGLGPEEMTTATFMEITHPDDIQIYLNNKEKLKSGSINQFTTHQRYIRRNGSVVWVNLSVSPLWAEGEQSLHHVAIVEDITKQKATEQALAESGRRITSILEGITDAFVALDTSWRYTYVNKKAGEIFDRSPDDLIGKHIWTEFPEGIDQPFYRAYYQAVERQMPLHIEEYYPPYDRWFENHIYPTAEGLSIFFQDITERKRAELEIRRLNVELERRVSERTEELELQTDALRESRLALMNLVDDLNRKTEELEHANARLKEVDRLKSLFIASMSHELRTPLNSIIGFSSILLHEWNGPLNEEQKRNLATVLKSGKHLLALVNDVIDVSKIEAGTIDVSIDEFDLHDLLVEVHDLFSRDAAGRELAFSVDALHEPLRTDRRRLMQCVINLVSNALKFTESGSVQVKTKKCRLRDNDAVEISVIDTGIGIAKEDVPRLFQSFLRLESPLRAKVLGTGLGLYLTKKLVTEILKGIVSVRSEPAQGSSFAIIIPTRVDA